jgi:hypothetical protein
MKTVLLTRIRAMVQPRNVLWAISLTATVVGISSLMVDAFARADTTLPDLRQPPPKIAYIKAANPFELNAVAVTATPSPPPGGNPFGPSSIPGQNLPPLTGPIVQKALTSRVIGIVVGPKSYAVIADGKNGYTTVTIGDKIDDRYVIDISLSGVSLSDGTLLAADADSGSFGFPAQGSTDVPSQPWLNPLQRENATQNQVPPILPPSVPPPQSGALNTPTPPYQSGSGQNQPSTPAAPYSH